MSFEAEVQLSPDRGFPIGELVLSGLLDFDESGFVC